jgi:hypothetical protein
VKILIRIVQAITALVLIFFSIGMFIEEFEYETQTLVNADPASAFTVFSNPANTGQWLPGFVRFEHVKGEPMTEGSQWKLVIAENGDEFEMLESVTLIKPGKQFSFVLENDILQTEVDIFFEQQGDKTLIRSVNKVKGNGLFWRSLLPLMKSMMKNQAEYSYNRLATLIEQQQ